MCPERSGLVPSLSIVAPFFNEEEGVDAFVDQVTAALGDSREWELIMVDDGSSDRTPELIARRGADDDRVRPAFLRRRRERNPAAGVLVERGRRHQRPCGARAAGKPCHRDEGRNVRDDAHQLETGASSGADRCSRCV